MELTDLDASDQAALVRDGEVTPRELVDAALARIEVLDGTLGAVIHPRFERAREDAMRVDPATQPFAGVPLLLKDSGCPQAGEPHHQGLRALRDAGFRETEDSWLVERFRAAGFVIVGRTNVPELCCMPTTEPSAYGPTRNPWSHAHSTGGSSGGSAAAVAARYVAVAHGGDGGGSIRMPASCCGLVGLKPSRGRLTRGPHEGEAWGGLATDGVLTRSVRDTAAVLDLIAGPGPGDPAPALPWNRTLAAAAATACDDRGRAAERLRIGVRYEAFAGGDPTHPEVRAAVERAAAALSELGHELSDGGPGALDDPEIPDRQGVVTSTGVAAALDGFAQRIGRAIGLDELEPITAAIVEAGRRHSALDYRNAREALIAYTRRVVPWWETRDLLLAPTITRPPPRLGDIHPELAPAEVGRLRAEYGWLTPPWNVTGQPAVSLPVYWSAAGLPIGVQLVAAPGREDVLVRVAAQLESATGWLERSPA